MNTDTINKLTTRSFLVAAAAVGMLFFSFTTQSFGQKEVFEAKRATSRAGLIDTGYMTKPDVSGELDGSEEEYFYKFGAGTGKLTITLEVTANKERAGATVDLFDGNNKALLSTRLTKGMELLGVTAKGIRSNLLAQGVDGGSEKVSRTVKLDKGQQDIIIRIKGIKYGNGEGKGTYTIRVEGTAVVF